MGREGKRWWGLKEIEAWAQLIFAFPGLSGLEDWLKKL